MESDLKVLVIRIWSLGFSSIAIGALGLMALSLALARGNRQVRVTLVLTCLSAICVMATHGPFALLVLREAPGWQWPLELRWPAIVLGEAMVGLLWLSMMVLFEDARITPLQVAPTAVLMALSLGSISTDFRGVFPWLAVIANTAVAAHAFVRVARGWRGDLVEKRRRLRQPLLLILTLVLALVLLTQGAEFASRETMIEINPVYAVLNVVLTVMALAAGALFLEPRVELLAAPAPRSAPEVDDSADEAALARLDALMTRDEVWRREGLTVGALAAEVGLPEHRLRVLINGRLGHRNFAAFVNARRIDAARRHLADPTFTDAPISKIAYDLGFASLGPFNRAFKDATGLTPSEWRRTKPSSRS